MLLEKIYLLLEKMRFFIQYLFSSIIFLSTPSCTEAKPYQTWYLGIGEKDVDQFLGRMDFSHLRLLLTKAGVELKIVDKPLEYTQQETVRTQQKVSNDFHIFHQEKGLLFGVPDIAHIPHHIRIVSSTPLEDLNEEQSENVLHSIQKVAGIMEKVVGHSHYVLVKGKNWMDCIPSNSEDTLDFAERCYRLIRLYDPESSFREKCVQERVAKVWKQAFSEPILLPKIEKNRVLRINNAHKGLMVTLDRLARALREKGLFLLIEEHGGEPLIVDSISVPRLGPCPFCSERVICYQTAYEGKKARVLYNYNSPAEAAAFMVIPKRHVARVEQLTAEELQEMSVLEAKVKEILEERFGVGTVVSFMQNSMPAGQTVFHAHTKIEYRTPILFNMASLAYLTRQANLVSSEEMQRVTSWFRSLMEKKLIRQ